MLAVASGGKTCSEENGIGEGEFLPWVRSAAVM
jgi:altronate hydrolase